MANERVFETNQFGLVVEPNDWAAHINGLIAADSRSRLDTLGDTFRTHSGEDILTFPKGIVCPVSLCGRVLEGSILAQLGREAIKTFHPLLSAGALEPSGGTIRTVEGRVVAFLPTRGTQGQILATGQLLDSMAHIAAIGSRSKDPHFRLALPGLGTGGNTLGWHEISKEVRATMTRYPIYSDLYLVSVCHPLFRQPDHQPYGAGVLRNL